MDGRRGVRAVLLGMAIGGVTLLASACKNQVTFGGSGTRDCGFPQTICSLLYQGVGDGGPALNGTFQSPNTMAIDGQGNLYIADPAGNRIRKIDTSGNLSTLVGTGQGGSAFQPGLPGPQTAIDNPRAVAVSPDGWVFWNDNSCGIYGLNPTTGLVEPVAGGAGNCDTSVDGSLLQSVFNFQQCSTITVDSLSNLIVVDSWNGDVRYVNRSTSQVTVVNVAVPGKQVKRIAGYQTYGGLTGEGGSALNLGMYYPCAAQLTPDGNLFITDTNHGVIQQVTPGGIGDVLPMGGLNRPNGVYATSSTGAVFVTDDYPTHVFLVNRSPASLSFGGLTVTTGQTVTVAGDNGFTWLVNDTGLGPAQALGAATAPVLNGAGDLLFLDPQNNVLRKVDHSTGKMTVTAGYGAVGSLRGWLNQAWGLALAPDGSLYVSSAGPYLYRIDPAGTLSIAAGTGALGNLFPQGLAVDKNGVVFVADPVNHRVWSIQNGTVSDVAGNGGGGVGGDGGPAANATFSAPNGITLDRAGNIYVVDDDDHVRFINRGSAAVTIGSKTIQAGNIDTIAGGAGIGYGGDGGPALQALFSMQPYDVATGLAVDDAAQMLYVADPGNNRIRRIDLATGIVTTLVGDGEGGTRQVGNPAGLALQGGYLYWTQEDEGGMVKRILLPSGPVEVLAGDGANGFYGDNGPALSGELYAPQGIAVGPDGVIYVADGSHHLRRIQP